MNALMVIQPYWKYGTWCFTDDNVGLKDEPFVAGIPAIIDAGILAEGLDMEECKNGFIMTFSETPFPEYTLCANFIEKDEYDIGSWYSCHINGEYYEGWLCPALFKYFSNSPKQIYVKINKK